MQMMEVYLIKVSTSLRNNSNKTILLDVSKVVAARPKRYNIIEKSYRLILNSLVDSMNISLVVCIDVSVVSIDVTNAKESHETDTY